MAKKLSYGHFGSKLFDDIKFVTRTARARRREGREMKTRKTI